MFKKDINDFKGDYFLDTPLKMSFFSKEKNSFINTDFDISIDKIEVIKHSGIAFYLKNYLIKYIKADNMYVIYIKEFDCFKIIYNNDNENIENKDVDFSNNTLYIRYGNSNFENNYSKNISIGDIVLPLPFIVPFKNKSKKESHFSDINLNLLCRIIEESEKPNFKYNEQNYKPIIKCFLDAFGYKVKDICYMNNRKLCLIELNEDKIKALKKDENIDFKKIIKKAYLDEENLTTEKNILSTLKSFIEH